MYRLLIKVEVKCSHYKFKCQHFETPPGPVAKTATSGLPGALTRLSCSKAFALIIGS